MKAIVRFETAIYYGQFIGADCLLYDIQSCDYVKCVKATSVIIDEEVAW